MVGGFAVLCTHADVMLDTVAWHTRGTRVAASLLTKRDINSYNSICLL